MRLTTIDKLCQAINAARGLQYPNKGYLYFADVKGDGRRRRRVWCITSDAGGITSTHNGKTYRHTAAALREVLKELNP